MIVRGGGIGLGASNGKGCEHALRIKKKGTN